MKMEYFETLKIHLRELVIFQNESDLKAKIIATAKRCGLLVTFISYSLAPTWYFVFEAQTPAEHSQCVVVICSGALITAWYSALVFQSEKYQSIIEELKLIVEKRLNDPTVNLIYENTRNNIEWMTKNLFLANRMSAYFYTGGRATVSLFNYVTTGFSSESLHQPVFASYPFDWRTLHGYAACVCIQLSSAIVVLEVYSSVVVLTVGICMLIANFASDIKEKVRQFNQIPISSGDNDDRVVLAEKLKDIIEVHSNAREFATRFSDLNQWIVVACPLFTVAVFGGLILHVNVLTKTGDIMGICEIFLEFIVCLLPFILFCHFGGKITDQFEEIGDAVYQLDWYRLPLKMQKDLKLVITLAQKPIYMRGYGDTRTTYSVFKKILKNKFYYFMFARRT